MSASLQKTFRYLDWKINAVFIKDLRIKLQNKTLTIAFMSFLALQVITVGMFAAILSRTNSKDTEMSMFMWQAVMCALIIICGALSPFQALGQFKSELKNNSTELVLLSNLNAKKLIRGKLFSCWCSSLLFISTVAPTLTFCYLIGGIDINFAFFTIFITIGYLITAPVVELTLATFKGFMSNSIVSLLVLVAKAIFPTIIYTAITSELVRSNIINDELWLISTLVMLGLMVLAFFAYQVAANRLRSPFEDTDTPQRCTLLAISSLPLLIYLPLHFILDYMGRISGSASTWEFLAIMAVISSGIFNIGLIFISNTSDRIPPQRKVKISRHGLWQLLMFPSVKRLMALSLLANFVFTTTITICLLLYPHNSLFYKIICLNLSFFNLTGCGLVAHETLAKWFFPKKHSKISPATTIIVYNLLTEIVAMCAIIISGWHKPNFDLPYWTIIALSPVTSVFQSAGVSDLGHWLLLANILIAGVACIFGLIFAYIKWQEGREIFREYNEINFTQKQSKELTDAEN